MAALNIRGLSDNEVAEQYKSIVESDDVINSDNQILTKGTKGGEQAGFKLNSADFKAGRLALYVCKINNETKYVIPVYGMGLWGPISGYIAIDYDKNTVFGAYFTHESETAGLGAEIKDNIEWQNSLSVKTYKDGVSVIALSVVKRMTLKTNTRNVMA